MVLLVLAIWKQQEGCLAKEFLKEHIRMDWPGLGNEVRAIYARI